MSQCELRSLFNELTQDIDNLHNKPFLKVSIISHMSQFTKIELEKIKHFVNNQFNKITDCNGRILK